MRIPRPKREGLALLALAILLFWMPYHLQQPGAAEGKILVATEKLRDGVFDRTVVVVLRHNGYGAFGLVVNRPAPDRQGPGFGGPVARDSYHTLYTAPAGGADAPPAPNPQLAYAAGAAFAKAFDAGREHITVKGYAGWGLQQLGREIHAGMWRVIDFDRELVFHTAPQQMWQAALQKPAAK